MASTESRPRSAVRLFAVYAVVSAVAVLLMGLALASSYRSEANRRGVAEGATEAQIVATTAVEPLLDGTPLRGATVPVDGGCPAGPVQRLRRPSLDSGSGTSTARCSSPTTAPASNEAPESDALEAAAG